MMKANQHFILNLCKKDQLGWYWYGRKYALRVDLQGVMKMLTSVLTVNTI